MAEFIEVIVKAGSGKSEVVGTDEKGTLRVNLKSPPQDNKANLELIKLLSKHFGRQATIKSGHTSKRKLIILSPR